MLNQDKYKTAKERDNAFNKWCFNRDCKTCKLKAHKFDGVTGFQFNLLALEAEKEKVHCIFCGSKMNYKYADDELTTGYLKCECGYREPLANDIEDAIAAHNRVCRAVEAVKKGDVK